MAKYKKGKKLDIRVDENLNGLSFAAHILILDAEQGAALAAISREELFLVF